MQPFHLYLYGPNQKPLQTSFEEAAERLQMLPKLYFEPDGSFVWAVDSQQQVYGMLYDAQGQLQYVDLRGQCSLATWQRLTTAIACKDAGQCVAMVIMTRELKDLPSFERSHWP